MKLKENHVKEQERDRMGDTIKLVTNESGDWEMLLLNGEIYYEGHNIPTYAWLNLFRELGYDVSTKDLTDEKMECGMY